MLNSSRMKWHKAVIDLQMVLNSVVDIIRSTSYTVNLGIKKYEQIGILNFDTDMGRQNL